MQLEHLEKQLKTQKEKLEKSIEEKRTIDDLELYKKYFLATFETLLVHVEKAKEEEKKKGLTEIEVNNGCKLKVELKDNRLIFTKLDAKGNKERADAVLDGEIVLLYDYILDRRDNGLELF